MTELPTRPVNIHLPPLLFLLAVKGASLFRRGVWGTEICRGCFDDLVNCRTPALGKSSIPSLNAKQNPHKLNFNHVPLAS